MFSRLLRAGIDAIERRYDYDMSYAREMLHVSRPAFTQFMRATRISRFNERVPPAAWFAAKLATTMAEDCGPCTQLIVQMALEASVAAADIRAVIAGDESAMSDDARLGWQFARSVSARDVLLDELRAKVTARWGKQAVVSLALVIAGARLYPTVKYALGHGQSCRRVRVGDIEIAPHPASLTKTAA